MPKPSMSSARLISSFAVLLLLPCCFLFRTRPADCPDNKPNDLDRDRAIALVRADARVPRSFQITKVFHSYVGRKCGPLETKELGVWLERPDSNHTIDLSLKHRNGEWKIARFERTLGRKVFMSDDIDFETSEILSAGLFRDLDLGKATINGYISVGTIEKKRSPCGRPANYQLTVQKSSSHGWVVHDVFCMELKGQQARLLSRHDPSEYEALASETSTGSADSSTITN